MLYFLKYLFSSTERDSDSKDIDSGNDINVSDGDINDNDVLFDIEKLEKEY
jgi:hypothetical protein